MATKHLVFGLELMPCIIPGCQLDAAFEIRETWNLILYHRRRDLEREGMILFQFANEQKINVNMRAYAVRIYDRNK